MWLARSLQPPSYSLGFSLRCCGFRSSRCSYRCRRPGFRAVCSTGDLAASLETTSNEETEQTPSKTPQMFYSEYPLDRAEHLRLYDVVGSLEGAFRKRPEELEKLAAMPEAELLPWKTSECLFLREKDLRELVLLRPFSNYVQYLDTTVGHIFMGLRPGSQSPVFAGSVADVSGFDQALRNGSMDYVWMDVRSIGPQIRPENAALIACANGMIEWHTRNVFSGKSGKPTYPTCGGYCRSAADDVPIIFPRIDPAVICLVNCGDYCLLGRKASWEQRTRYSLLSGFLEVGETLEQAVEREVFEESNIRVDPTTIVYRGSQPWPFPQSMMVGFVAELEQPHIRFHLGEDAMDAAEETCVSEEEVERYLQPILPQPVPQPEEMEDVRWFHRSYIEMQLSKVDNPEFTIPAPHAIAYRILTDWITDRSRHAISWEGDQLMDVAIDQGRFKYVLARVSKNDHSKIVVRGKRGRAYHKNVFEELQAECDALGLEAAPLGGGRIVHDAAKKSIEIYGRSSAFGTAVHDITAVFCRRAFPYYDRIKVAYSGY